MNPTVPKVDLFVGQPQTMAAHFPSGLRVQTHPTASFIHEQHSENSIAALTGHDHAARAAAIVQAVNNHDRLQAETPIAAPIAYTSQDQLRRMRDDPGQNYVMWGEALPHHDDVPLYAHPPAPQPVAVKALEWVKSWGPDDDGDQCSVAGTPFGSYKVERYDRRWKWGFCFSTYYDEDDFECDSEEDGKQKASAHWIERISPVFTAPAKGGDR